MNINTTVAKILIAGGTAAILITGAVTVFGQNIPVCTNSNFSLSSPLNGCPAATPYCNNEAGLAYGGPDHVVGTCHEKPPILMNGMVGGAGSTLPSTVMGVLPCGKITVPKTEVECNKIPNAIWDDGCGTKPPSCVLSGTTTAAGEDSGGTSIGGKTACFATGCEQQTAAAYACLTQRCGDRDGRYSVARCGSSIPTNITYTTAIKDCGLDVPGSFSGCTPTYDPTCYR